MAEFQVRKSEIAENRIVDTDPAQAPGDGEVKLKIDRFGFTSNNITYAAVGEMMGYWQFFPANGNNVEGWGVIPVWGFADVVESSVEDIQIGERIFGYFPPASYLIVKPEKVSVATFIDGAVHRSKLPIGYNTYRRVAAEPDYNTDFDNERMLLWPLLITSFCLWDALQEKNWHGAQQIVIASASSKTGIGLAYAIDADQAAPPAIGITSRRNLEFVRRLGLYEESVTYDDFAKISAEMPTVIVDMSGNIDFLRRLYSHLGNNMKHCVNVGITHWDKTPDNGGNKLERSEFFFAPTHIQKRMQDWGQEGFAQRTSTFTADTIGKSRDWLNLSTLDGLDALSDIYSDICGGRIAPDTGLVVKM